MKISSIEFLDAFEEDAHYFTVIEAQGKEIGSQKFRFGVDRNGYLAIRKILESRPFDKLPGLDYRYIWKGIVNRKQDDSNTCILNVTCLQGNNIKTIEFDAPISAGANLKWFRDLESFDQAAAMKI